MRKCPFHACHSRVQKNRIWQHALAVFSGHHELDTILVLFEVVNCASGGVLRPHSLSETKKLPVPVLKGKNVAKI